MEEFIVSTAYDGKQRKLYWFECLRCGWPFLAPKYTGKKHSENRKYCSIQCRKLSNPSKIHELNCAFCGLIFTRSQSNLSKSKSGLYFCSRSCKDKAQRLESGNPQIHPPHYGTGTSGWGYREVARKHHPLKCNRCGYDELPGILRVHHKDRDRTNSDPKNLEILCPNCHEIDHYLTGDGVYTKHKKVSTGH
jgi:ribosomal protein L37E